MPPPAPGGTPDLAPGGAQECGPEESAWPVRWHHQAPSGRVVGSATGRVGPTLRTSDGVSLATRVWTSERPARATVVVAHGFTSHKEDARVVSVASELHRDGWDVITYDSRGHGRSGGQCTFGALEHHDVAAVVGWVRSRGESHHRIVLVGASMGAVAVLALAAADPDVLGVVTVSSPSSWRLPMRLRSVFTAALARTDLGRSIVRRRLDVRVSPWTDPMPASLLIARVTCPVVAIHGRRDPIIPYRSGLAGVIDPRPNRSVVLVPGMGHAFDPLGFGPIRQVVRSLVVPELHDRTLHHRSDPDEVTTESAASSVKPSHRQNCRVVIGNSHGKEIVDDAGE